MTYVRRLTLDSSNRDDIAYDLWGDVIVRNLLGKTIIHDENKFEMKLNDKYGVGSIVGLYFDTGLSAGLTAYKLEYNLESPVKLYKKDMFFIGKILKGQFSFEVENDSKIFFNEGDVFAFSGNYYLAPQYYSQEKLEMIGVFGYRSEIIETLKKRKWYNHEIETILNDIDLKTGIKLSKTNEVEQIFSSLYLSVIDENRMTAYIKTLDLFYYFMSNYDKKMYTKSKTYTEKQLDTVIRIKEFLDSNLDVYYPMHNLADMFNISLSRMQSIFTAYYGLTPYRYHLNARLEKANELIINSDHKITEIVRSLGFNSYNKFTKAYRDKYNCNPSSHRII